MSTVRVNSCAFVYHGPRDVRLERRQILCGPTDLLVQVRVCGRCGTDRVVFSQGHPAVDPQAPIVLGHELVGEITWVGEQVKELREGIGARAGQTLEESYLDFRPGERVTAQPRIAHYRHGVMLQGSPITNLSREFDGAYAEYVRLPAELIRSGSVMRVPEGVSDQAGALTEPAACALESVFSTPHPVGVDVDGRHLYRAGIQPGGYAGVIGSGTVSLIYAKLAKLEGAARVFVFVRSQAKARLVRELLGEGFTPLLVGGMSDPDIVELVRQHTDGHLLDDIIAACSDPGAQRLMLELYHPRGHAVGACFGGVHQRVDGANLDAHHYRAAKTIGTSGCSNRAMETILRWLAEGRLSLEGLCSPRRWTLEDDPAAFFLGEGSGLKPMLWPWGA